ncbi:unnamed protein product [Linum trigynum]|uniref:Secreted protein n=1 Tax=Linum trigynum TaxID=586398 RepID=A0AAV2EX43_9ROSI
MKMELVSAIGLSLGLAAAVGTPCPAWPPSAPASFVLVAPQFGAQSTLAFTCSSRCDLPPRQFALSPDSLLLSP